MSIVIDPRVLQHTSHDLVRHGIAVLEAAAIDPPDTGSSYCQTQGGLEHLVDRVTALGHEVHDLGDAVESFLSHSFVTDNEIAGLFDALLAGGLS